MASPNSSLICGCFTPLWRFGRRCQKWNILENIHATKIHWLVSQTQPSASYWLFLRSFYQTCTPSSYLPEYPKCKTLLSPLLFSSFPPPSFLLPSHPPKKKKKNCFLQHSKTYMGTAGLFFSVVKGGINACSHQTSKLQHVKLGPMACPMQQWDY